MTRHVPTRISWSACVLVAAFSTVSAYADTVAVVNPSFETLPPGGLVFTGCGTGCAYSQGTSIPGWTTSGVLQGQFQPGVHTSNFAYFNTLASDGSPTHAYTNGGEITQTVSAVVVAGVTYTLSFELGERQDCCSGGSDFGGLRINGNLYTATGTLPGSGAWSVFTATYVGSVADAGQSITIVLNSTGPQGNFDNVKLNDSTGASAVPEPGMTAAAGLVALAFLKKFSRR